MVLCKYCGGSIHKDFMGTWYHLRNGEINFQGCDRARANKFNVPNTTYAEPGEEYYVKRILAQYA